MKNNFKRILAMLLAVMMVVGMCAFPVSAAEPTVGQPEPCDEHNWEFQKTVEPSCSKQGYDLYYCTVCYSYEQRNVKGTAEHTWEAKGEVLPTCTKDGHPAGDVCAVCGKFNGSISGYEAKPTCGAECDPANNKHAMDPAKGCYHVWGDPSVEGDPCKDPDAVITYECTEENCDAVNVVDNNDGHKWEWTVNQEPTCQEGTTENKNLGLGSATRYCSICETSQTVVIERLAHNFEISAAGSSADKCGETCTECGKSQASTTSHTWGVDDPVVVDAKCDVDGSKTYTCSCGYVRVDKIPAFKHGVSDKTTAGDKAWGKDEKVGEQAPVHTQTELKNHTITWKCAECKGEWVETVEEIRHQIFDDTGFEQAKIDATCTLDGVQFGRCTCGQIVSETIPAKEHEIDTTIDPDMTNYDCTTGGYYIYTCKCGEKFNKTVEPGTHIPVDVVEPNGCGKSGWEGKKCERCSWTEGKVTDPTSAHDPKVIITLGKGCVDDIVTYSYCKNAGCDYNFPVTDLAGLDTVEAIDAAIAASTSGKEIWKDVVEKKGSHSMSAETVIIPSTCHETGWWGYECANCELQIPTNPLVELDVNNHAYADKQYLVNFRWSCSANAGNQLYSELYCAACHNIYSVKSTVAKASGLNIEVGKYYSFNPETKTYTEVDVATLNDEELKTRGVLASITLYVEGVVKANPTSFVIDIDETKLETELSDAVITAGTGHVWYVVNEADCKNEGDKACYLCTITAKISTTNGHVEPADADKTEKTPASCTSKGVWEGPCQVCGTTMTGEIEKEDHAPVDDAEYKYLASKATCTANAKYYQICSVCKAKLETTFEKADTQLEHVYDKEITCTVTDCKHTDISTCTYIANATTSCIQKATYYKSCACGASSKGVTGKEATFEAGEYGDCVKTVSTELSHTAAANKVCVEYSYDVKEYCAVCDTMYTWTNYVAATGHVKNAGTWVEPTCVMLGYMYYSCVHCDAFADANGDYLFEIEIPEVIPEGEENEGKPNKNAPHVNAEGDELTGNCQFTAHGNFQCKNCPAKVEMKHNPGAADACGITTCTVCGAKDESKAEHDYVKDEDASYPATKDEKGLLVEVCSRCDKTKETSINKLAAVVYSLDVYNPYGSYIVNGGKAYVAINIKCNDINVSAIAIKLDVDETVFEFVGVVEGANALGGQTFATWDETNGNVTATAFAGNERESVPMNGDFVLCVLEFNVVYAGGSSVNSVDNDVKETDITFINDSINAVLDENNKPAEFDITTNASVKAEINQIGDIDNNGQIALEDVKAVLDAVNKYLANGQQFTEDFEYDSRYDINKDGKYSTADFNYLVQAFIGKMTYTEIVEIQE